MSRTFRNIKKPQLIYFISLRIICCLKFDLRVVLRMKNMLDPFVWRMLKPAELITKYWVKCRLVLF